MPLTRCAELPVKKMRLNWVIESTSRIWPPSLSGGNDPAQTKTTFWTAPRISNSEIHFFNLKFSSFSVSILLQFRNMMLAHFSSMNFWRAKNDLITRISSNWFRMGEGFDGSLFIAQPQWRIFGGPQNNLNFCTLILPWRNNFMHPDRFCCILEYVKIYLV